MIAARFSNCVWPLALLVLGACNFTVDPELVKRSGDDAGVPDSGHNTPHSDPDGGTPDANPNPPTDTNTPCETDGECEADHYCSTQANNTCVRRCDSRRGCAQVPIGSGASIVADGEFVFWSEDGGTDGASNPLPGKIFAWDQKSQPTELVHGRDGSVVLGAGPDLFFVRGDVLFSMPRTGAAAAMQLSTAIGKVWKTDTAVYWSRTEGADQQLWSLERRTASTPRLLGAVQGSYWIAGNDTSAVKMSVASMVDGQPAVVVVSVVKLDELSGPPVESVQLMAWDVIEYDPRQPLWYPAIADDTYLYLALSNTVTRLALSDLSDQVRLAAGFMPGTQHIDVQGDWVYWAGYGIDSNVFGRTHRELQEQPIQLLENAGGAVVVREGIVHSDDGWLFLMAQPPMDCSATTRCPADMSCNAKLVCE